MTVVDRQNRRHEVMLPDRAKVIPLQNQGWGWGRDRGRDNGNRYTPNSRVQVDPRFVLRPGDLVIVQGYLLADGTLWATTVRVYGRSYGWDDDNYQPSYHGHRSYGEVRSVDTSRNVLTIEANADRKTIRIRGELIINGEQQKNAYLRKGDRVVFYYDDNDSNGLITAYRVVLLKDNDRYPKDNEPCYCDPDYRDNGNGHGDYSRTVLEGRIDNINSGLLFNTLDFRTFDGKRVTLRAFKGLEAIQNKGDNIPVTKLRSGDRLRVYYNENNGTMFVQRIEVL
jgi:hypothetical protein